MVDPEQLQRHVGQRTTPRHGKCDGSHLRGQRDEAQRSVRGGDENGDHRVVRTPPGFDATLRSPGETVVGCRHREQGSQTQPVDGYA